MDAEVKFAALSCLNFWFKKIKDRDTKSSWSYQIANGFLYIPFVDDLKSTWMIHDEKVENLYCKRSTSF